MYLRIGKSGTLFLWTFVCLTAFFVVQCVLSTFMIIIVILTSLLLSRTALQACSRTFYAFSRDHGFPDKGFFGHMSTMTKTPLNAVWLTVFLSILPGLLDLASPVAAAAIFALTAVGAFSFHSYLLTDMNQLTTCTCVALDISYIIPIACRRIFRNHPDVVFTPGPFYMGDGILGWVVNINCILCVQQTLF